jgi:uncharacterized delta-60 repeat protein
MSAPRQSLSAHTSFEPLESRTLMSAGDLDTTFAGDGSALLAFPGSVFVVSDVAVAPDGKVVVSGEKGNHPAVARLNGDGSVDTTFATGGLFEFDSTVTNSLESATALAVQNDGKVVVVGNHAHDFAVARFTPTGALDTSFASTGIAITAIHEDASAAELAIQPDGKIVVVGHDTESEYWGLSEDVDFAVVRYNADGSPDASFNGDGIATFGFGGLDEANCVAIDTFGTPATNPYYGTIVVAGGEEAFDDDYFYVAHLKPDGYLDSRFDGDGELTTNFLDKAHPSAVVCQPGGRTVVAGSVGLYGTRNFTMVRYAADGQLDSSFGTLGTGRVEENLIADEGAVDMVAGDTGSLVVGEVTDGGLLVAGYTRDGVRDTRFGGGDGVTTVDFGNPDAGIFRTGAIAAGPGRQIVVSGGIGRVARVEDREPTVGFVSFDTVASETAPDTAGFWVVRDEPQPTPLRVYLTVGGTATPSNFKTGGDYTGLSTSVLTRQSYVDVPANQTFASVTITPVDDALVEGTETAVFGVGSTGAYDPNPQSPSITLSIRDNDRWLTVVRVPTTSVFLAGMETSPAAPATGDATATASDARQPAAPRSGYGLFADSGTFASDLLSLRRQSPAAGRGCLSD